MDKSVMRNILKSTAIAVIVTLMIYPKIVVGEIVYCKEANAIWVRNYPESSPANCDAILEADTENGWKKTTHNQETDTYSIKCSLWIGDEESTGTFFQIGRPNHLNETVIVHGDVWIKPPKEKMIRSDRRASIVNRLTLGKPENNSIRASLKIACEKNRQYGLRIGFRDKKEGVLKNRGELYVYNSAITAASQDEKHMLKPWGWYGNDIRLINSTISWIDGDMTYGIGSRNSTITGTVFENGGYALCNETQLAKNCVFRNLDAAVADAGCLNATFINCEFENNAYNWFVRGSSSGLIRMIDCKISRQQKPTLLSKNSISPEQYEKSLNHYQKGHRLYKPVIYPVYEELNTLVIKVVNPENQIIPEVIVNVRCENDPEAVKNGLSFTDSNGLTPANPLDGAILVMRKKLRATDNPEQPEEFNKFTYTISAQVLGYKKKEIKIQSHILKHINNVIPIKIQTFKQELNSR